MIGSSLSNTIYLEGTLILNVLFVCISNIFFPAMMVKNHMTLLVLRVQWSGDLLISCLYFFLPEGVVSVSPWDVIVSTC